ncbi:MAG TPA: hypothetical protein VH370_00770 [Humisphaera sp.]|jgi:hypothetical protein|nr:hypothetical protein [Humisphaera sp.]
MRLIAALLVSTLVGCVSNRHGEDAVRDQLAELSQRGPTPIKIHDLENLLAPVLQRDLRADRVELGLDPHQVSDNGKPRESIRLMLIANVPDEAATWDTVEAAVRHAVAVAGYRAEFLAVVDHRQSTWSVVAWLAPAPPAIA